MTSQDSSSKPNSIKKDKKRIRKLAREYRSSIGSKKHAEFSAEICERARDFLNQHSQQVLRVHVYKPMLQTKEIDTSLMFKWLEGRHTLYTQTQAPFFPKQQFDIVIVPGLAFSERGERVGYGLGAYDRFLATQKDAIVLGLQFDELVFAELPSEDHDKSIDYIITQSRTITCQ